MPLPERIDDWSDYWREMYEERAGVMEYEGNFPRWKAEIMAEQDIRQLASRHSWEPLT